MSNRNALQAVIDLAIVLLLLVGCGPQQTAPAATPVSEAPVTTPTAAAEAPAVTPTPVPPTATPTPSFKDPSECPEVDTRVSIPERLPNIRWLVMEGSSDHSILDVEILSADDIWAVGGAGNVLHYDGSAWAVVSSPTEDSLRGLSMLSANEGWAVGYDAMSPSRFGFILHYVNQSWSVVDSPSHAKLKLSGVSFTAPDNGWAVGTEILRYDGDNWITFASAEELRIPPQKGIAAKYGSLLSLEMISEDEGWAVGDGGTILHYQHGTWQREDSPVESTLWDVYMRSAEEGWIVGAGGTILHFDGTAWSMTASPTSEPLFAVVVDDTGGVWAGGANGTLLQLDDEAWVNMEVPAKSTIRHIGMIDDGELWAFGSDGLILRRELLATDVPPPRPPLLKTIDNSDGDGSFSISWESIPDNVKYILQEADESRCPVTIYFGPETSKEVSRKDIGTYYYRVSALGVSGQSEWSKIKSVEVTVPPPPCSVDCSTGVAITCESGSASYMSECWDEWSDEKGWLRRCKVTATYEESGNVYEFDYTSYKVQTSDGKVQELIEVTVTGGVFGDEPQYCQNY